MLDISDKDILDIIFELTHIKDEEGNDVPHFCFASDVSVDLDMKEEEIATLAAKNGYTIYKVFPGETMLGGLVIIAEGATIEPVETMYKEFYGEVPEISELILNDNGILEIKEDSVKEDLELVSAPKITDEDRFGDSKSFMDEYIKTAKDLGAELTFIQTVGPKRLDTCWYDGTIAQLEYEDYIITIFADGDEPEINWDGQEIRGVEELEDYGIYNDETFPTSSEYEYLCGPYMEFTIQKGDNGEVYGSYGDLDYESMWDLISALDVKDYIENVIPDFQSRIDSGDLTESKNKKIKIKKVGDPNAKAMWGRTRHKVELPKKGKGSFKRHPKHKVDEAFASVDDEAVDELIKRIEDFGFIIESKRRERDVIFDDDDDYVGVHIQIYDSKEFEHNEWETASQVYEKHKSDIDARISELADMISNYDDETKHKYHITYSIGFGGATRSGVNCVGRINAGIDMRPYWVDNDVVDINSVDESKKKKNPLKDAAKKHAKTDKKGAIGWFIAPNVEQSIQHFNHVSNGSAESTISAPAGLGEDITLETVDKYAWDFDLATDPKYKARGYKIDDNGYYTNDTYWFTKIPETCMKVSREDYKNNKLLKMSKNSEVLKGVDNFFKAHPSAKYCVIGCKDMSNGYGRYVNAWRVLLENPDGTLAESQNDYWVLSDGKNPRHSNVYSKIDNLESFIDTLESSKPSGYWELLHYVDGNQILVWCTGKRLEEKAEKHDTLNPKLWDESGNLKPEVREKIFEIVKEFTKTLEEDEIKFKIDDIVLVGSNCSYNYNDKSDLDIHIRMDTDSLECPDDLYPLLYSAYRSLFNNKMDIDFYGIPVEIYVETSETEQMNEPLDNPEEL